MAAPAAPMFTRGGVDAPDERGGSMVEKHREKLQKAKEEAALRAVRAAVPELGPTVCVLALEGAGWEADAALRLLRGFEADKVSQLAELQQKRAELAKQNAGPGAAESDSGGSDSDSSGSDRRARKRKRSSKSSKRKDGKRDGKRLKSKRDRKRSRDDGKKRSKASKEPAIEGVVREGYGAHGILRETDMYAKRAEFQAWAIDVKKLDIEIMPKQEEKELFSTFMEDFNTATLPHVKYYDLEAYEKRKAAKAAKKGTANPKDMEKTAFDDEAERRLEMAEQRKTEQAERLREAYNQLKYTAVGKAEDMREQEILKIQMQNAYRTGDHDLAEKLAKKLAPDEVVWRDGKIVPPK